MGFLGHGVRYGVDIILIVVSDLDCRSGASVNDLSFSAFGLQCAFQYLHCQRHCAFLAGFDFRDRPVDYVGILIICAAIRCAHELYVRVQRILDHHICCITLVVPVADLVCDLISDFYCSEFAGSFIRCRLFLHRRFRHGVLDYFNTVLIVVSDLHSRAVAAVDDLAFASLGLQRAFQHLHCQRHCAFLAGFYIPNRPIYCITGLRTAIRCAHELYVLIQRILDHHICCITLVVPVTDLVCDLVSDFYCSEFAGSFIR